MSDPVETRGPEREAAWKAVSGDPHLGAVWRGPFFRNGFDAGWSAAMAAADERERELTKVLVEALRVAHKGHVATEHLRDCEVLDFLNAHDALFRKPLPIPVKVPEEEN